MIYFQHDFSGNKLAGYFTQSASNYSYSAKIAHLQASYNQSLSLSSPCWLRNWSAEMLRLELDLGWILVEMVEW